MNKLVRGQLPFSLDCVDEDFETHHQMGCLNNLKYAWFTVMLAGIITLASSPSFAGNAMGNDGNFDIENKTNISLHAEAICDSTVEIEDLKKEIATTSYVYKTSFITTGPEENKVSLNIMGEPALGNNLFSPQIANGSEDTGDPGGFGFQFNKENGKIWIVPYGGAIELALKIPDDIEKVSAYFNENPLFVSFFCYYKGGKIGEVKCSFRKTNNGKYRFVKREVIRYENVIEMKGKNPHFFPPEEKSGSGQDAQ